MIIKFNKKKEGPLKKGNPWFGVIEVGDYNLKSGLNFTLVELLALPSYVE